MNFDVEHLCQRSNFNGDEYLEFLQAENAQGRRSSRLEFYKVIVRLMERIGITKRQIGYLLNNLPSIELRRCEQKLLQEVEMGMVEVITSLLYLSSQKRFRKALLGSTSDSKLVHSLATASRIQHFRNLECRLMKTVLASHLKGHIMLDLVHDESENSFKAGCRQHRKYEGLLICLLNRVMSADDDFEGGYTDVEDNKNEKLNRSRLTGALKDYIAVMHCFLLPQSSNTKICISHTYVNEIIQFMMRGDHV